MYCERIIPEANRTENIKLYESVQLPINIKAIPHKARLTALNEMTNQRSI